MDLMPNIERLVMEHLRAVAEVQAIAGSRVFTAFDASRGFPQVVVGRFGGAKDPNGWLDHPRLQIEVWADQGGRPVAEELTEVVRAAMAHDEIVGTHDLGVVTGSEEVAVNWAPDPLNAAGPARPRYIVDVRVHGRAGPSAGS